MHDAVAAPPQYKRAYRGSLSVLAPKFAPVPYNLIRASSA